MTDENSPATIDPNRASLEDLMALPGIGEALGRRLMEARPFDSVEDLLHVSGVGPGLLERIQPRMAIQEEESSERAKRKKGRDRETQEARPRIGTRQESISRSSAFVMTLVVGFLSALMATGLTLGVLLAINGTLNVGRHPQVQEAHRALTELDRDLSQLQADLEGVDQRLSALEGLTGRMNEVEEETSALRLEVDRALERVAGMRAAVDRLEASNERLVTRTERFEAFLDGLQRLLDSSQDPQAESSPSP